MTPSSGNDPRKRAAFETPAVLAEFDAAAVPARRPAAITAGTFLLVLRVAIGVAALFDLARNHDAMVADLTRDDPSFTAADAELSLWIAGGVTALVLLVQLLVAAWVYRGRNSARLIVMTASVVSISTAFAGWVAHGQEITLLTTLPSIGLDVLVLLALSSRDAAAWSRRPRVRRPRRR
ncbi:hypothetical protein [uncultured Microbacterium sp.]|uniref:hypothetical protein n=1 Tax=uncultured Microbacterium sp. TaxID=191216 RepID=UPI0025FE7551|nr:hypothetical protein [uncultured Microbacterium sp.]